jgi:hypothetical protein
VFGLQARPKCARINAKNRDKFLACYATRIRIWIPALEEPIKNWVNIHFQAAIIVAAAVAAVAGLALDRRRPVPVANIVGVKDATQGHRLG